MVAEHSEIRYNVSIPEDVIARLAKGKRSTAYAVRPGEPGLGRPSFGYGLIQVPVTADVSVQKDEISAEKREFIRFGKLYGVALINPSLSKNG